jgi:hypothetical protein
VQWSLSIFGEVNIETNMNPETREIIDQSIEIAILKSHATKPDWFQHHEDSDIREFAEIKKGIEEIKMTNFERGEKYAETVDSLAKTTSHNSGQITALWVKLNEEKDATKLIKDIASFGKIVKWIAYFIIGFGALFSAIKSIIFFSK